MTLSGISLPTTTPLASHPASSGVVHRNRPRPLVARGGRDPNTPPTGGADLALERIMGLSDAFVGDLSRAGDQSGCVRIPVAIR